MPHQSAKAATTTWLSPLKIVRALGRFDLDPCGYPGWDTARQLYCLPQDGLALPWTGRVWLNPPYTAHSIGRWLTRLADHGTGTAFIFARTDTEAFFAGIWARATGCLFLRGRVHFYLPDGTEAEDNGGAPSVLVSYGANDLERMADSGLDGKLVLLRFPRAWLLAGEASWREVVLPFIKANRTISLSDLYDRLRNHPKTVGRPNWRAKVRQTLQRARCKRTARATYTQ